MTGIETLVSGWAGGLNELRAWCVQPGNLLTDERVYQEVPAVREAMADIATLFIHAGLEDPMTTVHAFTSWCTQPLGEWGPEVLRQEPWGDFVLIDSQTRDLTGEAYVLLALDQTAETQNAIQLGQGKVDGEFAEEMRGVFRDNLRVPMWCGPV
jgi:hypothetical protein